MRVWVWILFLVFVEAEFNGNDFLFMLNVKTVFQQLWIEGDKKSLPLWFQVATSPSIMWLSSGVIM